MTRIERLTGILLLLQERPQTSDDIAARFEMSRRTVLRDIQALCEMGVPIIAQPGVGGGYSLPSDYTPAPLPLTPRETFLLLLSLSTITKLSDSPFAQERASLLAKLRALTPSEYLAEAEALLETVSVDVPQRPQRAPFLEPLLAAAREQQWVRVVYQSTERQSEQTLFPRRLYVQNGHWYCLAYAREREAERVYRVDRVQSLILADPLPPPAPPDPVPFNHL